MQAYAKKIGCTTECMDCLEEIKCTPKMQNDLPGRCAQLGSAPANPEYKN